MFDKYIKGSVFVVHAGKVYLLDYLCVHGLCALGKSGWYKVRSPLSIIHRVIPPLATLTDRVGNTVPLSYCYRSYTTYMDAQAAYKLHIPIVADRHWVTVVYAVVYAVVPVGKQRSRVVVKLYTLEGVLLAEHASSIYFNIPGTADISAPAIHGLI